MYAIIIRDGYRLFHNHKFIKECNTPQEAIRGTKIIPDELMEAIDFMDGTNHNVIEFGYNGYFTVSYYDNTIEF